MIQTATVQDVITPGGIASGALYRNRINPCETVAGETNLILRTGKGGGLTLGPENYTRCNAIIIDAMRILECLGYQPVLVRKSRIPLDLVGLRADGALIIEVARSRTALPNARQVVLHCRKEMDYLSEMKSSSQVRKMLWVYSPQCRWRFYDVFPGGVWLAKEMMEGDEGK
ncbi:hypothetical protein [Methanoregula sp.]|uniref:hypothetical protein n=1 Tax=Methanoregula sp. TaxID=2052170 RepID=UPI002BE6C8D1|nr:hypothetical protein [Methanoregula sp.]HVP97044.1 hypothetical protein [Methanoregula sp.]